MSMCVPQIPHEMIWVQSMAEFHEGYFIIA